MSFVNCLLFLPNTFSFAKTCPHRNLCSGQQYTLQHVTVSDSLGIELGFLVKIQGTSGKRARNHHKYQPAPPLHCLAVILTANLRPTVAAENPPKDWDGHPPSFTEV